MDKKAKIEQLRKRLKEIEPILNKTFNTNRDIKRHVKKNKNLYDEGRSIFEEIEQLEWELMSPEEQKKAEKRDRFLTLKAKGESFDLEEFDDLNV